MKTNTIEYIFQNKNDGLPMLRTNFDQNPVVIGDDKHCAMLQVFAELIMATGVIETGEK